MKRTPVLLLLLAWACCGLTAALSQPAASQPGWQQAQQRDAADTYTFTRFTLVGKFFGSDAVADRPALVVDCIPPGSSQRSKFLAADLLVGKTLKILYVEPEEIRGTNYFPEVAVRYRTDSAGQVKRRWPAGTDRIPTAKPSDKTSATVPRDALKKMLMAHTVAITLDDEHGSPIQMQFDMPSNAPVEAACRAE